MPDWTYQTVLRPTLFRLPADQARSLTLAALERLGANPLGPGVIALMGHAAPAPSLARDLLGLPIAAPVGIGADLPGNERGLAALARFGAGTVEVGPVALAAVEGSEAERDPGQATIRRARQAVASLETLSAALSRQRSLPARVLVRLAHAPTADAAAAAAERVELIIQLAACVDAFTLTPPPSTWSPAEWADHLAVLRSAAAARGRPLFVGVRADEPDRAEAWSATALACGIEGVLICGAVAGRDAWLLGAPVRAAVLALTRRLRQRWPQLTIIAAGGAQEPRDALALFAAGADVCQLDAGLVFSGPGLPKRINEAYRYQQEPPTSAPRPATPRAWLAMGWIWFFLLGLSLIVTGAVAGVVAATRVLLPYDEAFVGLTLPQLAAINPRLLAFMAHDRVTFAGTAIALGTLYAQLAWHALRFREHWVYVTLLSSTLVGFAGFLLYLGYGYFDPLHAGLTAFMILLFLAGARGRYQAPPRIPVPDLVNDRAWRRAQWGQLVVVSLGVGLITAGLTISWIGVTQVFVPEDLAFLRTTAAELRSANSRLLPLIAHDRAGFGGGLVATGVAVLLLGLWGMRRGARWVWWTLLVSGLPGYAAALGVHLAVGYLDFWHLLPALIAAGLFGAGLALTADYLLVLTPPAPRVDGAAAGGQEMATP